MKRFLIVFIACLLPVMLIGADRNNNAVNLTALKAMAMRGEDCTGYLGWYVYDDGSITEYDRPGVTGIIAYIGNQAVDVSLPDSRILVLSKDDLMNNGGMVSFLWSRKYETGSSHGGNGLDGYQNTRRLYENELNPRTGWETAGWMCWNMGEGIRGRRTTHWFLPTMEQWELMAGTFGVGSGDRLTLSRSTGMSFGSGNHAGYWTSTWQGGNVLFLNRSLGGTAFSTYNYLKVRAVFAF
ncbi:MAG: hypothetical protein IJ628_01945 [Bacteroidaceae bacterium]|nr:hypothetical protein [Bacteroidaceae bacterium]